MNNLCIISVILLSMRKFIYIFLLLIIATTQTFGYAIKVYDQWGNRIGTYKKEGDNYVLYDFYDKKVENPEELMQNPPNQKTLTNYTQYFYDENMLPIMGFNAVCRNTGRYYSNGRFFARCFYRNQGPSIVRPNANTKSILYEERYPYSRNSRKNINVIQKGL